MFPVLRTVYEMLSDRGYTPRAGYEWINDPKQLCARIVGKDLVYWGDREKPSDSVMVFFAYEPKLKINKARQFLEVLQTNNIDHAILVYANQITPPAKAAFSNVVNNLEFFSVIDLYVNRIRHELVPKHEMLSLEQVSQLQQKHLLSSMDQIPSYSLTDRVVRYYNWSVGTVVKIYRKIGNQKEPEVYYRIVSDKI